MKVREDVVAWTLLAGVMVAELVSTATYDVVIAILGGIGITAAARMLTGAPRNKSERS